MKPIIVTRYGEAIVPSPNRGPYIASENDPLKDMHHDRCAGVVELRTVSDRWHALCCAGCSLRVRIPTTVRTYAALREHFEKFSTEARNFEPIAD